MPELGLAGRDVGQAVVQRRHSDWHFWTNKYFVNFYANSEFQKDLQKLIMLAEEEVK